MRLTLPSERNYEVFHAIQSEKLSRQAAAERFAISPARVEQIVAEVRQFVLQHGDEELLLAKPEFLELGSLRLCYSTLDYFYSQVAHSRHAILDEPTPQNLLLNLRLIQGAMRLAIQKAHMAGRIAKVELAMIEAGTLDRASVADVELVESPDDAWPDEDIEPPVGGYTPSAASSERSLANSLHDDCATPTYETICDGISAAMEARKRAKAR
jgi:hypothetical protein